MRAVVIAFDLVIAVALFVAGFIFDLNGEQWAWWTTVSWIGVLVVTAAVVSLAKGASGGKGRGGGAVVALVGPCVVAVAVAVMAANYSDPYGGPLVWPHALALVALAGLALMQFGLVRYAADRSG